MRTILYILQKEFIQIFRDKTMLPIIFIMPIIQLIVLVNCATLEMKNINIFVVDKDLSSTSRLMISKFDASPFFNVKGGVFDLAKGEKEIIKGNADIILHIPKGFEKKLLKENHSKIQILINAINGMTAGITNVYANSIIRQFNGDIVMEMQNVNTLNAVKRVNINYSFWYNPQMKYKMYMLPGILVILVTVVGMFLTALNIVREKEMGTIEQINVTPIKKYQFMIGKLLPFWVIALFELAFGLLIGKIFFSMPIVGSIALLFVVGAVYLLVALGIGLFLATISDSQQQVMFISFFFLLIFILTSGIFTPIETMPTWAQKVTVINPIRYFMQIIRMILLKGSEFRHFQKEFFTLCIYAVVILGIATFRYKKVS